MLVLVTKQVVDQERTQEKTNPEKGCRGTSTNNVLPRQRNFIPTPGYSVLSDSEKDRRNKELAQRNREALQAMRDKCKVVITPIEDMPNRAVLLSPKEDKSVIGND